MQSNHSTAEVSNRKRRVLSDFLDHERLEYRLQSGLSFQKNPTKVDGTLNKGGADCLTVPRRALNLGPLWARAQVLKDDQPA
jgi:hypothetical protein